MKQYCLGFIFDYYNNVVLIKKNKPEWQKGLYNAIGGKIEPKEHALDAMIRECKEETGLDITNWSIVCYMSRDEGDFAFNMVVYAAMVDDATLAETQEEEEILVINLKDIYNYPAIENIYWLIPLAFHQLNFDIMEPPNFDYK